MSSNSIKEGSRTIKTKKVLYTAMLSLLKKSNFKKISVKEICQEALISRATFYAHFIDKYDLLEHWIIEFWLRNIDSDGNYEQIERVVNCHIHENMLVLKNLVYEADNETFDILFDYILSTMNLNFEKNNNGDIYPKNIVLSHFYAGGIMSYLSWQVKNKFPSDVPPMNRYLYEIIQGLRDFQSK